MESTKKRNAGDDVIVSKEKFRENFEIFTEKQLDALKWDNVFVAGGSVLGCLLPTGNAVSKKERRVYYHQNAYKSSDIDIFIYGLSAEQGNRKLIEIFESVKLAIAGTEDVICFRSLHAVTIVSRFPYRHIQIILRLYKSPAEVLMGFDIDACSVGYDGKDIWMTPRAHHAIVKQQNTIDMTRRSPSYEMRLAKYLERGFSIQIPSLDKSRIDPQIFEKRFDQVKGLAKLLLLTSLPTPEQRFTFKNLQKSKKSRPESEDSSNFMFILSKSLQEDDEGSYNKDRFGTSSASDYSTVFLPWGPEWTAEKVRKLMYTKDMVLNSKWYDPKKTIHTHPCFFGTASEIIKDCCGNCPPVPENEKDPDSPFVSGEITWLDINPGQQTKLQRIGSFHPITEGDWTEGAYVVPTIETLAPFIANNDHESVKKLLASSNLDVTHRHSSGRSLLHIAALCTATECAQLLIQANARISSSMQDGRTALHIAAQRGNLSLIKLLIERGAQLETEAEERKKDEEMKEASDKKDEDEDEDGDDFDCLRKIAENHKKNKSLESQQPTERLDEPDKLDIEALEWDSDQSAFAYAVGNRHSPCVEYLIEYGGAEFVPKERGRGRGRGFRFRRMHDWPQTAISNKDLETLKILLKYKYPKKSLSLAFSASGEQCNIEALTILYQYCATFSSIKEYLKAALQGALGSVTGKNLSKVKAFLDALEKCGMDIPTISSMLKDHQTIRNAVPFIPLDVLKEFIKHYKININDPINQYDVSTLLDTVNNHILLLSPPSPTQPEASSPSPSPVYSKKITIAQLNYATAAELAEFKSRCEKKLKKEKHAKNPLLLLFLRSSIKKMEKAEASHAGTKANEKKKTKTKVRNHRLAHQVKEEAEETEEQKQEKLKRLTEIRDFLLKSGAASGREAQKKAIQAGPARKQPARRGRGRPKKNEVLKEADEAEAGNAAPAEITYEFPSIEYVTFYSNNKIESNTENYSKMFNAVFNNDADGLEASTLHASANGARVGCYARYLGLTDRLTPLHLASYLNLPDMVTKLLEIASKQYSPPAPVDEKNPKPINNADLVEYMGRGGKGLGRAPPRRYSRYHRNEKHSEDPNASEENVSIIDFILSGSSTGYGNDNSTTALAWSVNYNSDKAAHSLLHFIHEHKLQLITAEKKPGIDGTQQLLDTLLGVKDQRQQLGTKRQRRFRYNYNSSEIMLNTALSFGHLDVARVLI